MKKVSVIVPVYNAEKYLNKSIGSLINQTLEDIEIIAVNDGSKDNSLDILREYERNYPDKIIVLSKENGGQATARNMALKFATGEYIICIDADDYVDLSMLEKMYNKAKEGDFDCVFCDHYEIRENERKYKTFKDYIDKKEMYIDALVSPWNKLINRDTLLSSNVIFPEGYIYEDTAWFANLIPFLNKYTVIHEPLLFHVIQANSTMTSRQEERTANILPVLNSVVDFYKKNSLYNEYYSEIEYFYLRIILMSSLLRVARIKTKKIRNEMIKDSFLELKKHFPKYKKNPYIKGKKGLYLRLINRINARFFVFIFSIKND
ncbi:MAG: glycosyltransferase family 2 protein [Clostridia bacterium]|nr:glycosyltransferase family 2 protein [Clostridia bacterium]